MTSPILICVSLRDFLRARGSLPKCLDYLSESTEEPVLDASSIISGTHVLWKNLDSSRLPQSVPVQRFPSCTHFLLKPIHRFLKRSSFHEQMFGVLKKIHSQQSSFAFFSSKRKLPVIVVSGIEYLTLDGQKILRKLLSHWKKTFQFVLISFQSLDWFLPSLVSRVSRFPLRHYVDDTELDDHSVFWKNPSVEIFHHYLLPRNSSGVLNSNMYFHYAYLCGELISQFFVSPSTIAYHHIRLFLRHLQDHGHQEKISLFLVLLGPCMDLLSLCEYNPKIEIPCAFLFLFGIIDQCLFVEDTQIQRQKDIEERFFLLDHCL